MMQDDRKLPHCQPSPLDPASGIADAAVVNAKDALALLVLDPAASGLVVGPRVRTSRPLELRDRGQQHRQRVAAANGVLRAFSRAAQSQP